MNIKLIPFLLLAALLPFLALNSQEDDDDAWYPRTATSEKGTFTSYAPQIESWNGFETMIAWTAFQIEVAGSGRKPYGSVKYSAKTEVNLSKREVLLYDLKIIELSIPSINTYELEYSLVRDAFLSSTKTVSLDLILEYLPADMTIASTLGLSTEAPPIYVSTKPALLLTVDMQPMFIPIEETGIGFAVNANWNLFTEKDSKIFYLLTNSGWITAKALEGPWTWTTSLPAAMGNLPDNSNWKEVKAALPQTLSTIPVPENTAPTIFYATVPSELLLFEGEPQWEAIAETGIDFASSTEQECFRHDGSFYFLTSGRWFTTSSFDNPWTLSTTLPEAFQEMPKDHELGYVRTSIPGTKEAWEAALEATIPQTAQFDRSAAKDLGPQVTYSGEPAFTPIEGTSLEEAINTSFQVIKFKNEYYLCYNAVWLKSDQATGPWDFADMIPSEFAKIPPSSPAYNTTFVQVVDSTPETVVYSSTAGYENSYVTDSGSVVNGTGFAQSALAIWLVYEMVDHRQDNWYGYPHYPYYPRRPSYGYGSWYNPRTGRYGKTAVGYGPYGAARSTAVYNPRTGRYARGQSVRDHDEWAGRSHGYNPNTRTSTSRRGYYDFDDNEGWSQSVKRRGNGWVASETEWDDGHMRKDIETSRGGDGTIHRDRNGDEINGSGSFSKNGKTIDSTTKRTEQGVAKHFESSEGGQAITARDGHENGFVGESGSGDVYAGRDGEVYKKTDSGWEQVHNSPRNNRTQTTTTTQSTATRNRRANTNSNQTQQLNRDYQSRELGTKKYNNYRSQRTGRTQTTGRRARR